MILRNGITWYTREKSRLVHFQVMWLSVLFSETNANAIAELLYYVPQIYHSTFMGFYESVEVWHT